MSQSDAEKALREAIRKLLPEIVRKKPGGGGYILYSPNKGKSKEPVIAGEFPTKLSARKAELARFPPKDASKLRRARKAIDKLLKDPKKAQDAEKRASKTPKAKRQGRPQHEKPRKSESIEMFISQIAEGLFAEEEEAGSHWEERIASMPKNAVEKDKKLISLAKGIEKKTVGALEAAKKNLQGHMKGVAKVSSGEIKKDPSKGRTYCELKLDVKGVTVGPIYVFVEGGKLKLEVPGEAKSSLGKLEPDVARNVRGALSAFNEEGLESIGDVKDAMATRDAYLDKVEIKVDSFVSDLTALELSILKKLLGDKYKRKI